MKKITAGIFAHVDAGKTTLSEALLYTAGNIRKLGRVDDGNVFLDNNELEKKRGITIYSHIAKVKTENLELTLLDTPGHIDFTIQAQQVMGVLDYAILVISATDPISTYTKTLWNLLRKNKIPVFIFVNKIDALGADKKQIMMEITAKLSSNCFTFDKIDKLFYENIATINEKLLDEYLTTAKILNSDIIDLITKRQIFPIFFGSAVKLTGISKFIAGITQWTKNKQKLPKLAGRVFKISHDKNNERLTWIRLFGGNLAVKQELNDEKINQIRAYNGEKFTLKSEAEAGEIIATTGLNASFVGQGIGIIKNQLNFDLRPVLNYQVKVKNQQLSLVLTALKEIEDEDPLLQVQWSEELQEIHVALMGEVQSEILKQRLKDQYQLNIDLIESSILYKETISQEIEAVGHFEPLRHYAEVHLILKPSPRDSGLQFDDHCDLTILTSNWQHQIMTALKSKTHIGVLIAAPITDMKITIVGGRGSNKHTVGGDFREATYRAVRQGLMELRAHDACQILEPIYNFSLELPNSVVGHALTDIQRMHGSFETPQVDGNTTTIIGRAPVATMKSYTSEVRNYTHGQGQLELVFGGYDKCHNAADIMMKRAYEPIADLANTPNSVFCSHGAGHTVTWDQVSKFAQYPYQNK